MEEIQRSVKTCLTKYVDFNGRAARPEFWWFVLAQFVVSVILNTVLPAAGFRVRPGTIIVRIGAPITTAGLTSQDRNTLARRARDAVVDLLHPTPGAGLH